MTAVDPALECSPDHDEYISATILEAQREADALVDETEAGTAQQPEQSAPCGKITTEHNDQGGQRLSSSCAAAVARSEEDDEELAPMPRLLELGSAELVHRTRDMKARGEQLDLLLLKAESYSHFIRMNQEANERATRAMLSKKRQRDEEQATVVTVSKSPSKRARGTASASKKSAKTAASSNSTTGAMEDADAGVSMSSAITEQPPNLVGGKLKDYQLDGLRWLVSLWENGLSGILGDEMGLGKTIQIIALIAHLRTTNTSGPFLIAGPLATLPNWMNEFKKWLPTCPVVLYHGSRDERAHIRKVHMSPGDEKKLSFPVVVTSFEICMIDRPHLERHEWQYIILDEGHRIKNRNCRLVRELKAIRSVSRILLTGTPIQNSLEELWSLLNFVNPRIFDDLEVFQAWFGFRNIGRDTQVEDIIGGEKRERIVSKLHEILRPFLLRRMKRDVLLNLPQKKEVVVYASLTHLQREYYTRVGNKTLKELLVGLGIEGAGKLSSENKLMQLRKVCNHPFLFGEPRDVSGEYLGESQPHLLMLASGKFQLLDRMLARLRRDGHRVLLFSQMTRLLDILQDYCAYKGYKLCRIDGSTKLTDRQAAIDAYNSDRSIFVFLLSTRAGGLGINLTGADTIILFDSDWNPHQDAQAQDRCHRIGQERNVVAYRLLTAGTVEIQMMEKQISKKKLERLAILGGDFSRVGGGGGVDGGTSACGAVGREAGATTMTLGRLRRLLEDDVRNLARMGANAAQNREALAALIAEEGGDGGGGTVSAAGAGSISDEELELILNRDKLFAALDESYTGEKLPLEGEMYDILQTSSNHLDTFFQPQH